jgi:hypothetical protein
MKLSLKHALFVISCLVAVMSLLRPVFAMLDEEGNSGPRPSSTQLKTPVNTSEDYQDCPYFINLMWIASEMPSSEDGEYTS